MTDPEATIEQLANPYRPVGLSSAYVSARMPDGTMSEGVGDTVEHALADANERWRAAQHG